MKPHPEVEQSTENSSANARPFEETRLLEDALLLLLELRELGHAHFRLAALETQRAGLSLVTMMVAGIMLGVLLNVLWFGLMAVVVITLTENGIVISSAILLALAFTLMWLLILVGVIRRASSYLQYPVISRSLQPTANREAQ
jgi:hypothetical protein